MSPGDREHLFEVAVRAVRAAGTHALDQRQSVKQVMARGAHDIKLMLDRECQDRAEAAIHEACPDAVILGEEGQVGRAAEGGQEWIVDPIDGTVNYFRGLPWWCSSVAVRVDGVVQAGAVYAPELQRLYAATLGSPSTCNGDPICAATTTSMSDAIYLTGISKTSADVDRGIRTLLDMKNEVFKIRLMGAAALDLCQIADGAGDLFFEMGIYVWDVAAGLLIARQAGARGEILEENADGRLTCYAAAPGLYEAGLARIRGCNDTSR